MIHLRPVADIRKMPEGKISSAVLYMLMALVAVVFVLFYFVGYSIPYDENPQFDAPLFTDALLAVVYAILGLTIVALFISAVLSMRPRRRDSSFDNSIPSAYISYTVTAFVALCLAVTFVSGSTATMNIGGEEYGNAFWLMAADMFVNTVTVLISVVIVLIGVDISGYGRKIKLRKRHVQKK